ncbi:hypothetical protein IWW37_001966 [Coemansia sp. RSA 2050]|nr:hypothetical protein IWW37_001966 [Coemansia sp. RSA 2050]KAJ2735448.1 hypothetical protein IW152_001520 [Coemansia sp. BCRC 34962]
MGSVAMRVDSLLNPVPTKPLGSGSDTEYGATTLARPSGGAHIAGQSRDDFEMALWRQECGLGPPQNDGPSVFRYFGQVSESPGSADQGGQQIAAGGEHGASESARGHAKYVRCLPPSPLHSGDTQTSPFHASALAYDRSGKQRPAVYHSMRHNGALQSATDDIRPQIFVARPPIVAHGAMSTDKSGDYIRSTLGSEHLLGQVVLSDTSAHDMHRNASLPDSVPGYAPCGNNSPGTLSSSPPSLSLASSASFSDVGSSSSPSSALSVKSQSFGKRLRLHPTAAAAAAAAVLTSLSGRSVADEFDEEDEDDDELDPYAEAFDAANRAVMPRMSAVCGYAGFGLVADGASSAPCSSSSQTSALTCFPPLPPMPRLANSSPSIATANLDDEKRSGSHKRKSSRASAASSVAAGNLGVITTATDATNQKDSDTPVRRHRAKAAAAVPGPRSARDDNSSSLDGMAAADAEDNPVVNWRSLEVPEDIWIKALELYDQVKAMKKVQNRQPVRKRPAILAALMFILCRNHGYPRTFAEICTAANVTKREIGMYYKLMQQVLDKEYTMIQRAKPSEFLQRWCTVLELPQWMARAATCIYDRADSMAIVQGKCPISVSAACMWLVVWAFNHRHALDRAGFALPEDTPVTSAATPNLPCFAKSDTFVSCDQHDVCRTAYVVIATLTSVFKLLLPHLSALMEGLMLEHL